MKINNAINYISITYEVEMISNLEYYKAFYYTAMLNSFSKAAETMYISQSAVSQSVKKLEDELGCKLFNRNRQQIQLTDEGMVLFESVKRAFIELQDGEQQVKKSSEYKSNKLFIGVTETAFYYGFSDFIKEYSWGHPEVQINTTGSNSAELLELLLKGEIDYAFVIAGAGIDKDVKYEKLHFQELGGIQDIVVAPASFGIKKRHKYSLEELMSFPLISVDASKNVRSIIDEHFASEGLIFNPQFVVNSMSQVLQYIKESYGIGIVPEEFFNQNQADNLVKVNLSHPLPERRIYFVYPKKVEVPKDVLKCL